MRRWLGWILGLLAVLLLLWAGFAVWQAYGHLVARVGALEGQVRAQEETLKTLSERLGKLEEEVFKAPAPPLSLPEVPQAPETPTWPFVVGLVLALLLLYLLIRLLRGTSRGSGEQVSPGEARVGGEENPPKAGGEGNA